MAKSSLASNPLRKYRKVLNLTLTQLADEVGVSVKTVYLAESGVYEDPLECIVHYFIKRCSADINVINEEYTTFRKKMRSNLKARLDPSVWRFSANKNDINNVLSPFNTKMSPLKDFRLNKLHFAETEFAKEFLINPSLLTRLEKGKCSLPSTIYTALIECGAPVEFVKELDARTNLYRG